MAQRPNMEGAFALGADFSAGGADSTALVACRLPWPPSEEYSLYVVGLWEKPLPEDEIEAVVDGKLADPLCVAARMDDARGVWSGRIAAWQAKYADRLWVPYLLLPRSWSDLREKFQGAARAGQITADFDRDPALRLALLGANAAGRKQHQGVTAPRTDVLDGSVYAWWAAVEAVGKRPSATATRWPNPSGSFRSETKNPCLCGCGEVTHYPFYTLDCVARYRDRYPDEPQLVKWDRRTVTTDKDGVITKVGSGGSFS